MPRPTLAEGKDLVTIEYFPGGVESTVLILNTGRTKCCLLANETVLCHNDGNNWLNCSQN